MKKDKAEHIVASLSDFVEREKKRISDENANLLREGRENFKRMVAERREKGYAPPREITAAQKSARPSECFHSAVQNARDLTCRSVVGARKALGWISRYGSRFLAYFRGKAEAMRSARR